MPIYEYYCHNCDERFEVISQGPEEQALCRSCGETRSTHLCISTSHFKFIEGYPDWVDKLDYHQHKQEEAGKEPTLLSPGQLKVM